jgi:hypothetical protein
MNIDNDSLVNVMEFVDRGTTSKASTVSRRFKRAVTAGHTRMDVNLPLFLATCHNEWCRSLAPEAYDFLSDSGDIDVDEYKARDDMDIEEALRTISWLSSVTRLRSLTIVFGSLPFPRDITWPENVLEVDNLTVEYDHTLPINTLAFIVRLLPTVRKLVLHGKACELVEFIDTRHTNRNMTVSKYRARP